MDWHLAQGHWPDQMVSDVSAAWCGGCIPSLCNQHGVTSDAAVLVDPMDLFPLSLVTAEGLCNWWRRQRPQSEEGRNGKCISKESGNEDGVHNSMETDKQDNEEDDCDKDGDVAKKMAVKK